MIPYSNNNTYIFIIKTLMKLRKWQYQKLQSFPLLFQIITRHGNSNYTNNKEDK